jgi:hypothetical protein
MAMRHDVVIVGAQAGTVNREPPDIGRHSSLQCARDTPARARDAVDRSDSAPRRCRAVDERLRMRRRLDGVSPGVATFEGGRAIPAGRPVEPAIA